MMGNKKNFQNRKKVGPAPKNFDQKLNAPRTLCAYSRHEYFHGIWYNELCFPRQGSEEGNQEV